MTDPKDARIAALESQVDALQAEMQQLSARLSHDLRAPLRHITSYAKLIQEEAGAGLTQDTQSFLGTISDSARHMGQMLDALAELSRISTVPLQWQDVPLSELVQEVQQQLLGALAGRKVQWLVQMDGVAEGPTVRTDAALLRLALMQVLGNALKFTTPREAAQLTVTLAGSLNITITVKDNGVGYNAAQQAHLFRPFSRLHSSSQFVGLGMGLLWSRQALRRLGGDVDLQLNPDGGCCATLVFPNPAG